MNQTKKSSVKQNFQTEPFSSVIKEEFEAWLESLTNELYCHELNFNNADTTSGQRVYSEGELKDHIKEIIKETLNKND